MKFLIKYKRLLFYIVMSTNIDIVKDKVNMTNTNCIGKNSDSGLVPFVTVECILYWKLRAKIENDIFLATCATVIVFISVYLVMWLVDASF